MKRIIISKNGTNPKHNPTMLFALRVGFWFDIESATNPRLMAVNPVMNISIKRMVANLIIPKLGPEKELAADALNRNARMRLAVAIIPIIRAVLASREAPGSESESGEIGGG
jgi:hypothetical protein